MNQSLRNSYLLYALVAAMLLVAFVAWLQRETSEQAAIPREVAAVRADKADQQQRLAQPAARETESAPTNSVPPSKTETAIEPRLPERLPSSAWNSEGGEPEKVEELIYANDFDRDFESWEGDKNIWQMGAPVAGPQNLCADDSMCIGTLLNDSYPDFEDAWLRSPPIDLPQIKRDESIRLAASSWHDLDLNDRARVMVSYFDGESWNEPEDLLVQSGRSSKWRSVELNLSRYAGKTIRLHFVLQQDENLEGTGNGWYIDDLRLTKEPESRLR